MPPAYQILRSLLFRLDAERAHSLALGLLKVAQAVLQRLDRPAPAPDPALRQELWGLTFPNPIGLAAGFDKNAELPHVWAALGFGFAELGSITAHAQPGNPRPRIFRLPADRALINRLGFNNRGATAIAARLAARLSRRRPPIPLGLNLGKSRLTPLSQAAADYLSSLEALFPLADYVAINVSSPNTPGLQDLQGEAQLEPLLAALQDANDRLARTHRLRARPALVKVSPDLSESELRAVVAVVQRCGVAGLIATNTTVARQSLRSPTTLARESGGLSGSPLRQRSTEVIRTLYRLSEGRVPIIGVGGVFEADDAYEKIRAGASLIQLYTGFVYEGLALPRRLTAGLRARLARDGCSRLAEAVGRDA